MSYFYPAGGGDDSIRLSISYLTEPEIIAGVARLAQFIEAEASACGDAHGESVGARTGIVRGRQGE
jgi:hypothetical protein